jgi:hypothetical protein
MTVSMPSATRGVPRVARGVGLAVCCAALGVAGHAAASGRLPELGPAVVLTVLLAAAGIALADRQRGLPAIASTVGGTQVGLHFLLDVLGHGHAAGATPPAPPADPVVMTGVHVVAAIVTALLLAGAERSIFALAGVLGWLLRGVPVRPLAMPACGPPVALPIMDGTPGELRLLLRRIHGRRGPPVPL